MNDDSWASAFERLRMESSPCDVCAHRPACARGLACSDFLHFCNTGQRRGYSEQREPSARLYAQLFGETDR